MEFVGVPILRGEILRCGCRIDYLPQGSAILPCKEHQEAVIELIRKPVSDVSSAPKINEMCWCAAKAEAKDAKCPIHD